MIEILVNGEMREVDAALSLTQALHTWGFRCEKIAVAINSEFVARADYAKTYLRNGDALDVVAPVQGG